MKDVVSAPLAIERRSGSLVADYIQLAKPRLNLLVVATSAAGYYLGGPPSTDLALMAQAVAGTALVAGGAAVLNQLYVRDTDALMRRTRLRPLPDGRVSPADARLYGLGLTIAGLLLLAARANLLAAVLAFATVFVYLIIYTPMKLRTPAATLVGAVPGALPALIGWTASHGGIGLGGLTLFFAVFNYLEARMPALLTLAAPPGERGAALGIFATSQFLGAFFGGAVGGVLLGRFGLSGVFWGCAIMAFAWAALAGRSGDPAGEPVSG